MAKVELKLTYVGKRGEEEVDITSDFLTSLFSRGVFGNNQFVPGADILQGMLKEFLVNEGLNEKAKLKL